LDRPAKKYCFSPKESVAERYRTDQPRKNRKPKSDLKHIRDHYTTDTYHQAVTHGIAQQATPRIDQPYRISKFRAAGLVYWTPHQLRHAKAQMIRDQFGLEAAQAVLGHSSLTATQIYARKRLDLARELAEKCG
jgi:integrase